MINDTVLPTPDEWIDSELNRLRLSQNELGRLMHPGRGGSSQISKFRAGNAGPQICIDLARVLNADPAYVLAISGHVPPPANANDTNVAYLTHVYASLNDENKMLLLDFARFLKDRENFGSHY